MKWYVVLLLLAANVIPNAMGGQDKDAASPPPGCFRTSLRCIMEGVDSINRLQPVQRGVKQTVAVFCDGCGQYQPVTVSGALSLADIAQLIRPVDANLPKLPPVVRVMRALYRKVVGGGRRLRR